MKSGSWSSFQSALPAEARTGGEPDDEKLGGEEKPAVKHCETCKYWGTAEQRTRDVAPRELRTCRRVARHTYVENMALRLEAIVKDRADRSIEDAAELLTTPEFGCVLHEDKT